MKRHRVAEWIKKYEIQQYAAWRDSFSFRDTHTYTYTHTQRKGIEKDIPCKQQPKESRGSDAYITVLPDSTSGKESTCQ